MQVKIASWNVNSIRARLENLVWWLKNYHPDIVALQEIKCQESEFPLEAISDLGYNIAIRGQKTYNGVAILSKFRIEEVVKELPNNDGIKDEQARYIEALIPVAGQAIRFASVYVPNGGGEILPGQQIVETKKFQYKLNFFENLSHHAKNLLKYNEMTVFAGDFNVGVEDNDVYDPKNLENTICFHFEERKKMRQLLNLGLIDSYRAQNPDAKSFSWWDYRGSGWQHDKGLRIDYLLCSPLIADKITAAKILSKGIRDQEKASDHCPVVVEVAV